MNIKYIFQRQMSSGKAYLPEIDGLRFVAIITVLLFHLYEFFTIKNGIAVDSIWALPFKNGAQGVQLFFIISGFILTIPFAKKYPQGEKISLKAFFLKRLTRLEPPYIISLLLFFSILVLRNQKEFEDLIGNLIASIFYVHNIVYGKGSDINTVAWSLEVEVQFYILVPLLALIFRSGKIFRRSMIILLIIISLVVNFTFEIYFRTLFAQFHYFLIGMLIADFYINDNVPPIRFSIFGFIGLFTVLLINRDSGNMQEFLFIVGAIMVFLSALYNSFWKQVFSIPIFALIGGMCYSIYLLHYPLISFAGNSLFQRQLLTTIGDFGIFVGIMLTIIMLVCSVFYLLIEKPCMNSNWPSDLKRVFMRKFRI